MATPLLFPAPGGGPLNLNNFRRREWLPAVEASGVWHGPPVSTTCVRPSHLTRLPPESPSLSWPR